jgi:hypothetical protein
MNLERKIFWRLSLYLEISALIFQSGSDKIVTKWIIFRYIIS